MYKNYIYKNQVILDKPRFFFENEFIFPEHLVAVSELAERK